MAYLRRFVLAALVLTVAACETLSAPATDSGAGSSSGSGAPEDACAHLALALCPAPCPAEYETTMCGTPCFNQGLECGDALGKGMVCDAGRWACETRPAPGRFIGCDLACRPICAPMDARSEDTCDEPLGYRWTGTACEPVDCSCVGSDCGELFVSAEVCSKSRANCHGFDTRPCAGLPCGTSCMPFCEAPNCEFVPVSCDAQGECTDRVPVCAPPPCPDGCPPPPLECTACDFGGFVCPTPMDVCIFGSCQPSRIDCEGPPKPD